jgi:nicotinamide-nucleotide amidase
MSFERGGHCDADLDAWCEREAIVPTCLAPAQRSGYRHRSFKLRIARVQDASMNDDPSLFRLAVKVGAHLRESEARVVTAESCTGGWIAKVFTDVEGSSDWYLGGVVAYSNALKQALLGVLPSAVVQHGAVSEEVAREMAVGALETFGGRLAISVTGIAGPGGGQPSKPVGTVWFGWVWRDHGEIRSRVLREQFDGDRESVRRQTVARALQEILLIEL